jgi:hypothetical protein
LSKKKASDGGFDDESESARKLFFTDAMPLAWPKKKSFYVVRRGIKTKVRKEGLMTTTKTMMKS